MMGIQGPTSSAAAISGPAPIEQPEPAPGWDHDDGAPVYMPWPKTMYDLTGLSFADAARGIVELYDRNGDGAISSEEQTRVARYQWSTYAGFESTYSLANLSKVADRNGDGTINQREIINVLRRFDTGDRWAGVDHIEPGTLPKRGKLADGTARDGQLSGSEFSSFMRAAGETLVSTRYWDDTPKKKVDPPAPLPTKDPTG